MQGRPARRSAIRVAVVPDELPRARATAGNTSVIMLSHKICRAPNGSGQPIMMAAKTVTISEKLQENR